MIANTSKVKTETTEEIETVELPEDECADMATDLSVDESDEFKHKIHAVRDLPLLPERYWDEISVEGIFTKGFRVKKVKGVQSFNLNEIYKILNVELTDPVDTTKRIKVSIWGPAIDIFKSQKPKINDHLLFHNLKMTKLDPDLAIRFGVMPFNVNCNARSSSDFAKLLDLNTKRIKFTQLSNITELNDQEVINLKASIVSVRNANEKLRKVLIKQASGKSMEIDFWQDKTSSSWHPELKHLGRGMFCAFYGLYLKVEAGTVRLVASDFTRIFKIKMKK